MQDLEQILVLFVVAIALAAAARRAGAPYPVFLAVGGGLLALVPGAPSLTLPPDLVLALFVAPILVDAGYDASQRDLRDNWAPLVGLVVVAVVLTTAAVAIVAHALVPSLPWAQRSHWAPSSPHPTPWRRPRCCARCIRHNASWASSKARAC